MAHSARANNTKQQVVDVEMLLEEACSARRYKAARSKDEALGDDVVERRALDDTDWLVAVHLAVGALVQRRRRAGAVSWRVCV